MPHHTLLKLSHIALFVALTGSIPLSAGAGEPHMVPAARCSECEKERERDIQHAQAIIANVAQMVATSLQLALDKDQQKPAAVAAHSSALIHNIANILHTALKTHMDITIHRSENMNMRTVSMTEMLMDVLSDATTHQAIMNEIHHCLIHCQE